MTSAQQSHSQFEIEFAETLLTDVLSALQRVEDDDIASHRREAIRTLFAAIEGLSWMYREFVATAVHELSDMTALTDLALREKTYSVTEDGRVVAQTRFITVTAMIRLSARLASSIAPESKIDFGTKGWETLKKAVAVRNRLTHPKSSADLQISTSEMAGAKQGFYWLMQSSLESMDAINRRLKAFNADMRNFVDQLVAGKPDAIADYENARDELFVRATTYNLRG